MNNLIVLIPSKIPIEVLRQNLDTSVNTEYKDPDTGQVKKPRAFEKRKTLQMSLLFNMN